MKKMSFFVTARDGILFLGTIELGFSDYKFIIVPFPAGYNDHIGITEFIRIVEESYFDGLMDMLAFKRSDEIDWKWFNSEFPWIQHD